MPRTLHGPGRTLPHVGGVGFTLPSMAPHCSRYAKIAEEDPHFVSPAYAVNQPATLTGGHLAKTVDSDDEEEKKQ